MKEEAIEAYVDVVSAAVQLPIPAEYRQGVIDNLRMILAQSAPLMALPLADADEMAPVFRA